MKNSLLYVSGSFVLVGTILLGISVIFTNRLVDYSSEIDALESKWENIRFDMEKAFKEYDKAWLQRNHMQILTFINPNPTMLQNSTHGFEVLMKHSVILAHHAARFHPNREMEIDLNNLKTYEELKPLFIEYIGFARLSQNVVVRERIDFENKLYSCQSWQNRLSIFGLIINSCGLLLGIISVRDKRDT